MNNINPKLTTIWRLIAGVCFLFAHLPLARSQCTPAPAGIVAWWPGDGNANDVFGANNGTLVGGVTFATGEIGQAFSFDGVNGEVSMPLQPVSDLLSPSFTIEFWARSGAGAEPTFGFLGSGAFNSDNPLASYNAGLSIGDGAGGLQMLPPLPDAPSASWAYYAIVCHGSNYTVYFDSVVIYSEPVTVLPAGPSSRQFVIGKSGFALNTIIVLTVSSMNLRSTIAPCHQTQSPRSTMLAPQASARRIPSLGRHFQQMMRHRSRQMRQLRQPLRNQWLQARSIQIHLS